MVLVTASLTGSTAAAVTAAVAPALTAHASTTSRIALNDDASAGNSPGTCTLVPSAPDRAPYTGPGPSAGPRATRRSRGDQRRCAVRTGRARRMWTTGCRLYVWRE